MNGILNFTQERLVPLFNDLKLAKFRVQQVVDWIYCKGVTSFSQMTNFNGQMHGLLSNHYYIYRPQIATIKKSADGTMKFLFKLDDGLTIETVFIPEEHRNTICVQLRLAVL